MRRLVLALALVVALAACGGSDRGSVGATAGGSDGGGEAAALWVTRDHGAKVLLTASVPAGLTVIQALDREAEVETRYGGRFVQAIDGIEGSLARQQDWFYFVNGIEPDVGAADVELRTGDVAWWDFRSWADEMETIVVVGAFPEPFLHGWAGKVRPLEVVAPAELAGAAESLEALLAGDGQGEPNRFVLEVDEAMDTAELTASRGPANDAPVTFLLVGPLAAVRAAVDALVRDPAIVRFRYTARFDETGRVVG